MYGNDRQAYRQFFLNCRAKQLAGARLEPMERIIVQIIEQHPEYHGLLDAGDKALEKEFLPELGEVNPFLHLGLHISLMEQLDTDRPSGIRALYQTTCQKLGGDSHAADHLFMDHLGEAIFQAQRSGRAPDEAAYMAGLGQAVSRL